MSDEPKSPNLSQEAADALLKAIADLAEGNRNGESLHHLADAYAAVRASMPKRSGRSITSP